jgi:hypothetical protein
MATQNHDRLGAWTGFLNALGNFGSKLIWGSIGIIIIATLGRFLHTKSQAPTADPTQEQPETEILKPIPWHDVDEDIVLALQTASGSAKAYASKELAQWTVGLQQRIDDDFLKWYFSYWQQQWMGLKAMGYWIADHKIIERMVGEQPNMAERMTEEIQEEFSKRVLRPQIAQLRIERIADSTIQVYVQELSRNLTTIPEKYQLSQSDWERYLNDIALLTENVEGNRDVSISLKTVAATGVAGGTVAAVKVTKMLKPMIAKIGTKMTTKASATGAGKVAAALASKTGAKVGAKVGGKFLGAIVGVGVIIWDVWDHRHTKKIEKPILRENLADYLTELQHSLLHEPGTGLMSIVHELEGNVVSGLKTQIGE